MCHVFVCIHFVSVFTILKSYFGAIPTVWYFGAIPTVWYFGPIPTVWYFFISLFFTLEQQKMRHWLPVIRSATVKEFESRVLMCFLLSLKGMFQCPFLSKYIQISDTHVDVKYIFFPNQFIILRLAIVLQDQPIKTLLTPDTKF